jgi:hypothetical protein
MGRRGGAVNYKNEVLIKIFGKILPNGEYGWQAVAIAYQDATKEETSQDTSAPHAGMGCPNEGRKYDQSEQDKKFVK